MTVSTKSLLCVLCACVLVLAVLGGVWGMSLREKSIVTQTAIDAFCAKHGTDVKKRFGNYGETLLHFAAKTEEVGVVRFLIDRGADINAETDVGATPLDLAKKYKNTAAIEILSRQK